MPPPLAAGLMEAVTSKRSSKLHCFWLVVHPHRQVTPMRQAQRAASTRCFCGNCLKKLPITSQESQSESLMITSSSAMPPLHCKLVMVVMASMRSQTALPIQK